MSAALHDLLAEVERQAGEPITPESLPPGLLASVPDAMAVLDPWLRVIGANGACCRLFGTADQDDVIGRDIFRFLPARGLAVLNEILGGILSGVRAEREIPVRLTDGREVSLEVRASPLRDRAGRLAGFSVLLQDVTRRRAVEDPLSLILESTAGATGDLFFRMLVESLARALDMRHVVVGKVVGMRGNVIQTMAVWSGNASAPELTFAIDGSPFGRTLNTGIRIHPAGVAEAFPEDALLAGLGAADAQSYIGTTLVDSTGHPIGILAVVDDRPLERTGHIGAIMQLFAIRASAELERLRVEHALRSSQERLSTAVSGTSDGLFDVHLPSDEAYISPRCAELLGLSDGTGAPIPATGSCLLSLVHPDDLPAHWKTAGPWSSDCSPSHAFRIRHQSDGYRWYECRSTLIRDGDGRPLRHLGFIRDVNDTRRLERLLSHTSAIAHVGGWESDTATGEHSWTHEVFQIFGADPHAFRPSVAAIRPCFADDTWHELMRATAAARPDGPPVEVTVRMTTFGGDHRWIRVLIGAEAHGGTVTRRLGAVQDVTAFRHLEEQLIAAQKMEGIGRLAGGVAHDFNNLLTAILGACDVAAENTPPTSATMVELAEIRRAAVSASMLTRQLLAFARRDVAAPRPMRLDRLVAKIEGLLERVIGADVELVVGGDPLPWPVLADPGQLEQVVVNLAVNARDAMPGGGRLTIETGVAAAPPGLPQGEYAVLRVSDTGIGMAPEVQRRIFEPFYTTKPQGEGTGLGLAMCHGIVAQAGGLITVTSAPGAGATFEVFLPRHQGPVGEQPLPSAKPPGGNELVLVLEDEPGVRRVCRAALQRLGYQVLEASSGADAVEQATRAGTAQPVLLLTDVVLPGQSGPEAARELTSRIPDLKVLYMTGYAGEGLDRGLPTAAEVLQKPFTLDELGRRIRSTLDGVPA